MEIGGVQDGEIRLKVTPEVEITSRLVKMNFQCFQENDLFDFHFDFVQNSQSKRRKKRVAKLPVKPKI